MAAHVLAMAVCIWFYVTKSDPARYICGDTDGLAICVGPDFSRDKKNYVYTIPLPMVTSIFMCGTLAALADPMRRAPIQVKPSTLSFETPKEGTYLFLVHGYTAATYDLDITPGGGPKAWRTTAVQVGKAGQATSFKGDELISEPVLPISGPDPLAGVTAPAGPFAVHLPLIFRQ